MTFQKTIKFVNELCKQFDSGAKHFLNSPLVGDGFGTKYPLDADRDMTVWGLEERFAAMIDKENNSLHSYINVKSNFTPDLEPFANLLADSHKKIREFRNRLSHKPPHESFIGRWEKKLRETRRVLDEWRSDLRIDLVFGSSHIGEKHCAPIDFDSLKPNAQLYKMLKEIPFSFNHKKENYSPDRVQIRITSNFFTKVLPFFSANGNQSPPFIEKISQRADGTFSMQYMVFHLEDSVYEVGGIKLDHGIKVAKFHGIETTGRYDDRTVTPVTRFLAYTGEKIGPAVPSVIIGTATTPKRAYQLLRSRIARDLMKKL